MLTTTDELNFLGARARILADGLVELLDVPAGDMPPLHLHRSHDEGFFVLDGEVTLFQPGTEVTLRTGDFFLAERGIPHTYRVGDEPAHVLVHSSPAGFERFVAGVAALPEPDPAALAEIAAANDIDLLGPPGTMP